MAEWGMEKRAGHPIREPFPRCPEGTESDKDNPVEYTGRRPLPGSWLKSRR